MHERAFRLVNQNSKLSFVEFLEKDNSETIHQRNLHVLATESFKLKKRDSSWDKERSIWNTESCLWSLSGGHSF